MIEQNVRGTWSISIRKGNRLHVNPPIFSIFLAYVRFTIMQKFSNLQQIYMKAGIMLE